VEGLRSSTNWLLPARGGSAVGVPPGCLAAARANGGMRGGDAPRYPPPRKSCHQRLPGDRRHPQRADAGAGHTGTMFVLSPGGRGPLICAVAALEVEVAIAAASPWSPDR